MRQHAPRERASRPADEEIVGHGMDRPLDRPSPWRRHALLGAVALLIFGAAWVFVGGSSHAYRIAADRVTLGTVTRAPFEDFIAVRATAAPLTTRYLTAEQGGSVQQVLVEDGAKVRSGQPLIVLTNATLQLQIASREADAASQINALENVKLQLEEVRFKYQRDLMDIEHQIGKLKADLVRDKVLLDGNAIAPTTYKQEEEDYAYQVKLREAMIISGEAEQKVRQTQLAQVGEALARLNESVSTAKASLDALTIRAPVDGQLTALDSEVGQSKAQGAILGQVDSTERFKISAQVDEFYLGRVAVGQMAQFSLEGRAYSANVAKVYPQVSKGTFKVDLDFAGTTPANIRAGQAIDIKLELGGATNALTLPNGPFYQDSGGHWAFVLGPDGHSATRRNIRLGRRNPENIEVIEGLEPGELVITSAYESFQKFERVEIATGTSNK
jgi:HlyD family secretion protein